MSCHCHVIGGPRVVPGGSFCMIFGATSFFCFVDCMRSEIKSFSKERVTSSVQEVWTGLLTVSICATQSFSEERDTSSLYRRFGLDSWIAPFAFSILHCA